MLSGRALTHRQNRLSFLRIFAYFYNRPKRKVPLFSVQFPLPGDRFRPYCPPTFRFFQISAGDSVRICPPFYARTPSFSGRILPSKTPAGRVPPSSENFCDKFCVKSLKNTLKNVIIETDYVTFARLREFFSFFRVGRRLQQREFVRTWQIYRNISDSETERTCAESPRKGWPARKSI